MSDASFSDEDLTAFLDGEADPELNASITAALDTDANLTARLASLDLPIAAIRSSYDALLSEAPELPEEESNALSGRRIWPWAFGTFATGLAAGFAMAAFLPSDAPAPSEPGWKAVVASYQSLYGQSTLDGMNPAEDESRAQLAQVSAAIGLDLSDLPAPAGLRLKHARLLNFKGRPLAQLAYQREDGTPVALCIIKLANGEAKPMNLETLAGLGAANWNAGGFGYLLIGGDDQQKIEPEAVPFARWSQSAT
ncbi:MAG: hypothetical protein ABJQ34_00305 [Paracoccaceae bacterium]